MRENFIKNIYNIYKNVYFFYFNKFIVRLVNLDFKFMFGYKFLFIWYGLFGGLL